MQFVFWSVCLGMFFRCLFGFCQSLHGSFCPSLSHHTTPGTSQRFGTACGQRHAANCDWAAPSHWRVCSGMADMKFLLGNRSIWYCMSTIDFSPTAIAFGSSAIVKVPCWAAKRFRGRPHHGSAKVSPKFRWVCFTKVPHLSQMTVVSEKVLFPGFRQLLFTFNCQSRSGVKVAWVVDMSHPYTSVHLQSAETDPLCCCCWGYSLGLFVGWSQLKT